MAAYFHIATIARKQCKRKALLLLYLYDNYRALYLTISNV